MIKFSILGFGHIGKVHYQAIKETVGAKLVAIIDLVEPILEESTANIDYYTSLEHFLENDTETDVVVIATPNGMHHIHAISCLQAGKNVLIEKPMALDIENAKAILATAEENNKRVFSSMQLRFSPVVQYVKNALDQKALGEIYMVNIQCFWNRNKNYYKLRDWHGSEEMDGGVLFTQFSHFIDIMNFWFDDVKCLSSVQYNFNHQGITEFGDSGKLEFKADSAHGHMVYTTATFNKNFESTITIIAEKGTIKIGDQYLNKLLYADLKHLCCSDKLTTEQKNFHPNAMNEIVEALTENKPSILDGKYALNLVQFITDANEMAANEIIIE
ncbi:MULTISPECIES: Gfo/Idh/MocA family protein [Weeksella]|uniref:Gfo/Idh/MocA family protein n=1 Tax=Weeksella TaxID=1013 RepID=UPI0008A15CC6|nr:MULTISPECIES: Gfo/Idh/MocA family oxidoreductase [Weeksella]MDK7375799.1 Gfo/Idh/MocA family oxidoreductase [Weeksella virosa]OFM83781.1 oxidoreductase [Weeksella sp. HMSC059D05]